jgi:peptide/nickel transport system permease protein
VAEVTLVEVAAPTVRESGRPRRLDFPIVAVVILGIFVLVAAFGSVLTSISPIANDLTHTLMPPFWVDGGSLTHPLGTDQLGRDVWSRLLSGARPSLIVALLSVVAAGTFGSAIGIFAAYSGGLVDLVLTRLVDIVLSFPSMIIALLLAAQLGPGFANVVLVMSLILWTAYARQVRGDALVVMRKDYIALARIAGRSGFAIMAQHVLPNVLTTVITLATLQFGVAIIIEASLSYLGVGVPPPAATWGGMIADGQELIRTGWWLSLFPGLAITATESSAARRPVTDQISCPAAQPAWPAR